jgi:integrase
MASVSAYKTKQGTRYRVSWSRPDGSRTSANRFPSLTKANDFKRQVEADQLREHLPEPKRGEKSFNVYAEQWLATRLVKGRPLSPSTLQGYRKLLRRFIYPTFEHKRLRAISVSMVRQWRNDISASHGPNQAAKAYTLLRAILATAVEDDQLMSNPCKIRGAGQETVKERPLVSTDQVLQIAEAIDPRYRVVVFLAGFGGLRMGEISGLRRSDINETTGTVMVERAAVELYGEDARDSGGGRLVGDPKSAAGKREVPIGPVAMEVLLEHLESYVAPAADSWVLVAPQGGPAARTRVSKAWVAARRSVGAAEELHLHDLRHHAATKLAQQPGITLKELMAHLGHSSMAASMRYQHAGDPDRQRSRGEWMDQELVAARDRLEAARPAAKIIQLRPRRSI